MSFMTENIHVLCSCAVFHSLSVPVRWVWACVAVCVMYVQMFSNADMSSEISPKMDLVFCAIFYATMNESVGLISPSCSYNFH